MERKELEEPVTTDGYRWLDQRMGKMMSMRKDYRSHLVPAVVTSLGVSEEQVVRVARDGPGTLDDDKIIYALLRAAGDRDTPPVKSLAMEDVFTWSYGVGKVKINSQDPNRASFYGDRYEKGYRGNEHLVPVAADFLGGEQERREVEEDVLRRRAFTRMNAYNFRVLQNYFILRYTHDEKIKVREAVDRYVSENNIESEQEILRFRDSYRNMNDGDGAPEYPFQFQKVEQFMVFEDTGVLPEVAEVEEDDVVFPTGEQNADGADENDPGLVTDEDTVVEEPTDVVSERTVKEIMMYAIIEHYPKMRGREYAIKHKLSRGFAFVGRSVREVALQIEIHHKTEWREAVPSKAEADTPNEYQEEEA